MGERRAGWSVRERREMARRPGLAVEQRLSGADDDARVTLYVARDGRQSPGCHTRVQGFGLGGRVSNSVRLNLKSRGISPYRTYSASTWVPEQLPAPLDSARNEIGQCATGDGGRLWTMPATKLDSLSSGCKRGRAERFAGAVRGCPADRGRPRRPPWRPGGPGDGEGHRRGRVLFQSWGAASGSSGR